MKQKLLLIILTLTLFAAVLQAQINVIDFGAHQLGSGYTNLVDEAAINSTIYSGAVTPGTTGNFIQNTFTVGGSNPYNITWIGGTGTSDRLYSNNTGLAVYSASAQAPDPIFSDYDAAKIGYIQPNGTGNTARRHWQVTIPDGETVTFMIVSPAGSTSTALQLSDDDGANWSNFTDVTFIADKTYAFKISNSSGSQKTYRWYDGVNKVRLFRVYFADVSDAILGINNFKSPVSTNIKAVGNRIYVSNVKTSTEVNIYTITGALVKSLKTNTDTDFSFKSGLYIATVKTEEGQKAVKLLTY